MTIGVLDLQGAVKEHIDILKKCKCNAKAIKTINELESIDGLIVPGGESTTIISLMEKYSFLKKIREFAKNGLPILGTCTGLIILSKEIIDGKENQKTLELMDITTKRNAFGRQRESFEAPLKIEVLGEIPFLGVFIRAPIVIKTGNGVNVLAKFEDKIVGVQQNNLIGLSFHPELTADTRLHKYFIDIVKLHGLTADSS